MLFICYLDSSNSFMSSNEINLEILVLQGQCLKEGMAQNIMY